MTYNPWRIAGIAGLLFIVLFIVGVAIQGDVPTYDEGGEEIATWFADNSDAYWSATSSPGWRSSCSTSPS